jgi:hypothetical protein
MTGPRLGPTLKCVNSIFSSMYGKQTIGPNVKKPKKPPRSSGVEMSPITPAPIQIVNYTISIKGGDAVNHLAQSCLQSRQLGHNVGEAKASSPRWVLEQDRHMKGLVSTSRLGIWAFVHADRKEFPSTWVLYGELLRPMTKSLVELLTYTLEYQVHCDGEINEFC